MEPAHPLLPLQLLLAAAFIRVFGGKRWTPDSFAYCFDSVRATY